MTSSRASSQRPRVICHMVSSIDGRILTEHWPLSAEGRQQYEIVHRSYEPDGWLCGRVTMEQHFAQHVRSETEIAREHHGSAREDYRAPGHHESYAFAVDTHGRLAWSTNDIDGDHVVAVLSERVSDEYLASLRERGISYLLAGAGEVDLGLALEKVAARFGLRTLMLEGGGKLNGGMMRAGLVVDVSVLVAPVVDGRIGTPALFDVEGGNAPANRLALESVERRADDVLWLRYRVVSD